MNIELYIISETNRRAKRLISFEYTADREISPALWSGENLDHVSVGPVDYNGNLSIGGFLDMNDTYRVLVIDKDENQPQYQMNNVVLTSCKSGGFFAIGNRWEYIWVAANVTLFPEMGSGWDDYYFGERKVNFEF